ncbi:MAG: hypothetical protein EBR71_04690 [Planctomycetes bacterium]|nr:hypothetical protein [Planctomycetota bacterium]
MRRQAIDALTELKQRCCEAMLSASAPRAFACESRPGPIRDRDWSTLSTRSLSIMMAIAVCASHPTRVEVRLTSHSTCCPSRRVCCS